MKNEVMEPHSASREDLSTQFTIYSTQIAKSQFHALKTQRHL